MRRWRATDTGDGSAVGASALLGLAVFGLFLTAYVSSHVTAKLAAALILGTIILVGALSIPAKYRTGVLIGVCLVGGVDGLPGPDLDAVAHSGLYAQDGVVVFLVAVLIYDIISNRLWDFYGTPLGRFLLVAALLNVAWWLVTLYRSSLMPALVISHSASFARDFLYVVVLVPLLAASFRRREGRNAALVTAGLLSIIPAAAFTLTSISHSEGFSAVLHPTAYLEVGGLTRVYSPVSDLFNACFPVAVAAALLVRRSSVRWFASVVALASLTAIAAGQTRAQYIGTGAGLVLAAVAWRGPAGRLVVRRLATAGAAAAVIVAVVVVAFPHSKPAHSVSSLASRISSITSTASSHNLATSTVAVRTLEAHLLEQRLGDHAAFGLGFISPRDVFDPDLPYGTIRNSDVGLLNVIMTMGIVGVLLYYLPILAVTGMLVLRRLQRPGPADWLGLGALVGCLSTLITSITLVTFFSPTGVVTVAALVGLGAAALAGDAAHERGESLPNAFM